MNATFEDLIAQHGWTATGARADERGAQRGEVQTEAGVSAVLYVYADTACAARAAAAHRRAGPQLFAVPQLINSGPGWLLVEHPGGAPLSEMENPLARSSTPEMLYNLGQAVRKLHEVPCEAFCGDLLDEDEGGKRWLTFSGYVAHQLEWFSENLRLQSFAEETRSRLVASIGDLRHELSAFHPRNPVALCHGSLSPDHIWVDEGGREICGITGFAFAAQIPREADIAYLLWIAGVSDERLVRKFYDGYGAARTMDVQRRERFYRRLVALQALLGAKGELLIPQARLIELTSPTA